MEHHYSNNNRNKSNQQSQNTNSRKFKKHRSISDFSLEDLTEGKHIDLVAAALLLSGKLKVDSVRLFRGSTIITVNLIGKFQSNKKKKSDPLADFFEENGDLTFDEIFEAFQQKMDKGDNS